MRRNILYQILFFIFLMCTPTVSAQDDLLAAAKDRAVAALTDRFDEGNGVIYVYRDFSLSLHPEGKDVRPGRKCGPGYG